MLGVCVLAAFSSRMLKYCGRSDAGYDECCAADPGHPLAVGEAWARAIPGADVVTEEPGSSPIAWQGGQLSRVIAQAAAGTVQ